VITAEKEISGVCKGSADQEEKFKISKTVKNKQ
jgi:hypothetical protein